jgi:serine/threonine protein kinase
MPKSGVLHGDLKLANLLLDEDLTANLGDFGISKSHARFSDAYCFRTHGPSRRLVAQGFRAEL